MTDDFRYDVFLSHSSKDKPVVRPIAERLREDGLRVWLDEWEISPGDNIPSKIEEGLEQSRVLVLCMSKHAFGSDWATLESQTLRFRDPLNRERRFIPLRLDETPIKGSLSQFLYITWPSGDFEQEHAKLFEACRPPVMSPQRGEIEESTAARVIQLDSTVGIRTYAFSPDGKRALTGSRDRSVRLWDLESGACLQLLEGHRHTVRNLLWSIDQRRILSCSDDRTLRLWDLETGHCLCVFEDHRLGVNSIAWSDDQGLALSGGDDKKLRLWNVRSGRCIGALEGHTDSVWCVALSADRQRALSGSDDRTIRLWDLETSHCLGVLQGHTHTVRSVLWSSDQSRALSCSRDATIRLWDLETGRCLHVFEGHTGTVRALAWEGNRFLSGSSDKTVRLWDLDTGHCIRVLEGHSDGIETVAWSADQACAFSGDFKANIRVWHLETVGQEKELTDSRFSPTSVHYTNAKVLLVGESGAGKTGLSKRLASEDWQPSDSTVGAWATQWKVPIDIGDSVEREVWLWDFGGQADQRLIHQLYMDETALAVLVFDGQKEDLFETLGQWDRDLTRSTRTPFSKLLVAGRVDAGGLRVSRAQIEAFKNERGYLRLLETSAKSNIGCEELRQAIIDGIQWENIPWRSSPLLFKRLKEEIVTLKDEGRALLRFNELREALSLRISSSRGSHFTDEELKAVIGLLAGPGVVWELKFGSWVLLRPELINTYAQAVIQAMREDEHERGCISEERVLSGDLKYYSSTTRLAADEERFVLLAMHQTLVERGLCLREHTDKGTQLVFPSYYRRERPELVGHPAVLVSYRFTGFLDDIYATLVVRLHHTDCFSQDQLWRYAADFKTLTKKQLGVKMSRRTEGAGEIEVYFDPDIPIEEKMIFSRYVHEHLLKKGSEIVRLRHYICPHCRAPVRDRETAMERLAERGKTATILCVKCEKRVPLWDELEERFADPALHEHVLALDKQSQIVLDSADKERTLVGEVISTTSLAGQICRELTIGDNGVDMEIEFKTDAGRATGRKVYLQLKSGDSYLTKRKRDGAEIFKIEKARHVSYWMNQAFPVLLVIRNSEGHVRWMEIRDYLKQAGDNGKRTVKQIVFEGERFDVMSVRRWRDRVLRENNT